MGLGHSRLEVADKKPTSSEIEIGEIAINMEDALLYTKKADGTIISVGGSGAGGFITQNENTLTEDFILNVGESGVATSFVVADNITLTVPDSSILSIV